MRPSPGTGYYLALATAILPLLFAPLVYAELTTAQSWGKQIYFEGTSPTDGEINAVVGSEAVTLPASAVPCASCHGSDGLGRPEGGVLPPDIRWSELTKSYGHVHEDGRKHPAFDENNVARLIRTGLDPASNRLDQSMPLYNMSVEDMDSLVAYMKFLENDWDPGVSEDSVQVGTLLPLQGPRGSLGQAMAQVILAHFKEVNKRGGIYGRKIELLAIPYGNSKEATLDNLEQAISKEGFFALVGAYTVGLDEPILALLSEHGVPLVGPFTLSPGDAFTYSDSFYIYPGFTEQAQVLVDQGLADNPSDALRVVIVGPEGEHIDGIVESVKSHIPQGRTASIDTLRYPQGGLDAVVFAAHMQKNETDILLFLGNQGELENLLKVMAENRLNPRVYALSAFVPRPLFDAPETFNNRIFLAYPTLSSDMTETGRAEYVQLSEQHALPPGHLQGQVASLAAAKLLVEGLRGAGRTLNRERLVDAIEALYRYDTGLTPPLTYGPNRRIGARGAHIMAVDLVNKTNVPVGEWHEVR